MHLSMRHMLMQQNTGLLRVQSGQCRSMLCEVVGGALVVDSHSMRA